MLKILINSLQIKHGWNILKSKGSNFYCRKYAIGGGNGKKAYRITWRLGVAVPSITRINNKIKSN